MDAGRGVAALLVLEHHCMVYFGERVGEVVQYGDTYRLAYIRGPEGISIELLDRDSKYVN